MMTGKYYFNNDREILSILPYVYHFYLGAVHVLHEGNRELLRLRELPQGNARFFQYSQG